jgi:hypothetical protein
VNIISGILLKKGGGRFCSALIDSSTAEQNTTPHPCERTSLAARRHIHFLLHGMARLTAKPAAPRVYRCDHRLRRGEAAAALSSIVEYDWRTCPGSFLRVLYRLTGSALHMSAINEFFSLIG